MTSSEKRRIEHIKKLYSHGQILKATTTIRALQNYQHFAKTSDDFKNNLDYLDYQMEETYQDEKVMS